MSLAFTTTPPLRKNTQIPRSTTKPPPHCSLNLPHSPSRRHLLLALALTPALLPSTAFADRTGKYSTKLTAKRRYLPRISRGLSTLSTLLTILSDDSTRDWAADASSFVENDAPDLRTAMQLFATTYFSEGNRIGATERALGECVDDIEDAVNALNRAAKSRNRDQAKDVAVRAIAAANKYVDIAKVEDAVPLVSLQ